MLTYIETQNRRSFLSNTVLKNLHWFKYIVVWFIWFNWNKADAKIGWQKSINARLTRFVSHTLHHHEVDVTLLQSMNKLQYSLKHHKTTKVLRSCNDNIFTRF